MAAWFPLKEPDHGVPARIQENNAASEQQIYCVLITPAEPMRVIKQKLPRPLAEPFVAKCGKVKQQYPGVDISEVVRVPAERVADMEHMVEPTGNRLLSQGRVQAQILYRTGHGTAKIGGEQRSDIGYRKDVRVEIEHAIQVREELAELQPQQSRGRNVIEQRYISKPVLDVMSAQAMWAYP